VGGTTYEEAKVVAAMNAQFAAGGGLGGSVGPSGPVGAGTRILLGGTCVHNSKSYVPVSLLVDVVLTVVSRFLQMAGDASSSFPAALTRPSHHPSPSDPQAINLNLGPVSLNVDSGVAGALEAGVDAARDGLRDLFGKVRKGVDGVRLA
jgi:vacuolar protein sorting-associated protein 45